ncbi:UNVERIFIED_CONTAM: hypothetical protein GTU68_007521 [Idotea baltica]|nr:hypothetical protein [Idotea baltica]
MSTSESRKQGSSAHSAHPSSSTAPAIWWTRSPNRTSLVPFIATTETLFSPPTMMKTFTCSTLLYLRAPTPHTVTLAIAIVPQ